VPRFLSTLGLIAEGTDRGGVPNWLSTHPHPENRVERVEATVEQELKTDQQQWRVARDKYLSRIDGIIFGDNPREGIVRGNAFLHPDLRFALEFPSGWEINNTKTQVLSRAPRQQLYVLLQIVQEPQGRNIEEIAQRSMSGAGFTRLDGSVTRLNGLPAYVGTYQGQMEGLGQVGLRTAHIQHGDRVYLLTGIAQANAFRQAEGTFNASIQSFRPLAAGEAADIRPNRVNLYTARSGDTWQAIAERTGGIVPPETLAVMNGYRVEQAPRAGDRLKIVVGG
jgi:predicted Zn-dependent protease